MNLLISLIFVIGLGCFIYRVVQFAIFILNPLPGDDLKWKRQPRLPTLKSRKLKKKHLLDFLRSDRIDIEDSLKDQSFPMNSIDEENMDSEELDQIPDIEINSEDIPRSHRIPYQNTSSPKQSMIKHSPR